MPCPFCRESVVLGAIKCRHCSSTLVPMAENAKVARFGAEPPNASLAPARTASDNGNKLGALYLSLAMFCLIMIISGCKDPDAQDVALGSLLFIGAPAVVGSVYVMSSKTIGVVFSYFALACSGLSLLVTLSLFS